MLSHDNIDVFEEINAFKTNKLKDCNIFNYHYYFLKADFRFWTKVYDVCHFFNVKYYDFFYVAIVSIEETF